VARKLDPSSSAILADKGELLRRAERYDEARAGANSTRSS
jgi:hypothetical protein